MKWKGTVNIDLPTSTDVCLGDSTKVGQFYHNSSNFMVSEALHHSPNMSSLMHHLQGWDLETKARRIQEFIKMNKKKGKWKDWSNIWKNIRGSKKWRHYFSDWNECLLDDNKVSQWLSSPLLNTSDIVFLKNTEISEFSAHVQAFSKAT